MAEQDEPLLGSHRIKVVDIVSEIVPVIEAVRPGCSSGVGTQALCLLITELDKAKSMIQHCRESSRLYLLLTGDAILLRFENSRNILEHCLNQIQNLVHVELASEITRVMASIKGARFSLDQSEEEAGKGLLELLHEYATGSDSIEEISSRVIEVAATRLQIRSGLDALIEKTSKKNMLRNGGDCDAKKKKILLLFLGLLNKYGRRFT